MGNDQPHSSVSSSPSLLDQKPFKNEAATDVKLEQGMQQHASIIAPNYPGISTGINAPMAPNETKPGPSSSKSQAATSQTAAPTVKVERAAPLPLENEPFFDEGLVLLDWCKHDYNVYHLNLTCFDSESCRIWASIAQLCWHK